MRLSSRFVSPGASMRVFRYAGVSLGLGLVLSLALAACGGAGSGGGGGYGYGASSSTNTPAATSAPASTTPVAGVTCGASGALACTKQVMVNGAQTTVLSTPAGKTIYYFKPDTTTTSNCTGSCASTWPAVTASSGATLSAAGLPGTLATLADGNGNQVTYQGHPLYTYSGDQQESDATGEGLDNGAWNVATPTLSQAAGGSSGGGGGYGGYGSTGSVTIW